MRDIRKGLEQRIEKAKADRAQLERRIVRLDEKAELWKQALESERGRVLNEEIPHA